MSRKKCQINENSLGGRLRIYRESNDYNIVEFSKLLTISHGSLSEIENNKSKPSFTPINNLIQKTDINLYWLLTGQGEMKRQPPEQKTGNIAETTPTYNQTQNPEFAELIIKTKEILESKTDYSASLAANIRSFFQAIKTEKRLNHLEKRIEKIEKKSCRVSGNPKTANGSSGKM